MSLIIKRVKNISRRKRKSRSRTRQRQRCGCCCCCNAGADEFDDDASKFTVIEDFYSENFPPLRPVYRKDIFGTPIVFRVTNGIDYRDQVDYTVRIHSITFMKEYKNKSFEELRWQDYSCGRREILHYEENSYLRCLSAKSIVSKINYKFFEPAPKNIPLSLAQDKSLLSICRSNCSADELFAKRLSDLSKANVSMNSSIKSSRSFDELMDCEKYSDKVFLFAKDDSILDALPKVFDDKCTGVVKESRRRSILTYVDKISQTLIKNNSPTKSSSDMCSNTRTEGNSSKQESIEMLRTNLTRYFEKAEPTATMPYDFVTQNPKFFLPCAEIGFVYQNARPSTYDLKELSRRQRQCPDKEISQQPRDEAKYICNSTINRNYFKCKFHPYFRTCRFAHKPAAGRYILSGKDVVW
ncbi:unnamed protein product [Phyllotreta striolata]|uniref:Nuclear pore complex protein Nup98-Nup96 n=1 Tax=Phyllotreta striolata TaxID=444603 RepID=A0A9N9TGI7_PHYSR|nr:unnamed protein product [Phyllotreta striolata]